jgi:hypothetical protein
MFDVIPGWAVGIIAGALVAVLLALALFDRRKPKD